MAGRRYRSPPRVSRISPHIPLLIIGAGPCGLGCARELDRLGRPDWLLLEREPGVGGLARSVMDEAGFTWDLGGHVVFSHFGEFDALLAEAMGEDVHQHDRSSYVRFHGRWVPYPFQNHLRHLPPDIRDECLAALARAPGGGPAMDFDTWSGAVFGEGIAKHFMRPYNFKVWATPLREMASQWIGERVAVIDYERALHNVREDRDDPGWGPNNQFVFPSLGGTGEIYRRVAERLEQTRAGRIRTGSRVASVRPRERTLELETGETITYEHLVSTMPLNRLVELIPDAPHEVRDAARQLRANGVYMVGVGIEAPLRDDRSWLYFPEPGVPFYRVTNFAKYAAANVPDGDTSRYMSLMTETSFSPEKPEPREGLEERVVAGLRDVGLLPERARVLSAHVEQIDMAYPVPTLGRDRALATIQPWLAERGILSRGRFGAWRYEIGNMDHAVKMGIDVARRIVLGEAEELFTGAWSG